MEDLCVGRDEDETIIIMMMMKTEFLEKNMGFHVDRQVLI